MLTQTKIELGSGEDDDEDAERDERDAGGMAHEICMRALVWDMKVRALRSLEHARCRPVGPRDRETGGGDALTRAPCLHADHP
ncbi:hypothetical protein Mro03_68180 [Microbispora rosea subsp. rosea]|nr:hypothetical protein Mro03_68180 [Microbispora rosea subsp. rosea]